MGLVPALTSFSNGTTADATQVNANYTAIRDTFNTYAVLTDTAKTIAVAHTWSVAQTWSAAQTFAGVTSTAASTFTTITATRLDVANAAAILVLNESDQTLNNKKWRFFAESAVFSLQVWDDAESTTANVFSVTRSGATVTGITLYPAITTTSSMTVGSLIVNTSGITVNTGTTAVQALTATTGTFSGNLSAAAITGTTGTFTGVVQSTATLGGFTGIDGTVNTRVYSDSSNSWGAVGTFSAHDFKIVSGGTVRATVDKTTGNWTMNAITASGLITGNLGLTVAGAKSTLAATVAGYASLNLPHGTAPSAPANGDVWTTTAGVFARVNGTTLQLRDNWTNGLQVCSLYSSVNFTVTAGATTEMAWNQEFADPASQHSTVSNAERVLINTNEDGNYMISVVMVNNAGTALTGVNFEVRSGGTAGSIQQASVPGGLDSVVRFTVVARGLTAGGYVSLWVNNTTGGTITFTGASCSFQVSRIA